MSRLICICICICLLFGNTMGQPVWLPWKERLALFQLRTSLGLRTRDWPFKSDPCASWIGIQCNNATVTGINISGLRRTRMAALNPSFSVQSLQNLSHLSSFNASRFPLPGSIPEWFGLHLLSLTKLDLSSCSIIGTIPSSLSQLVRLSVLDLSHNSLIGSIPPSFSSLGNLTLLNLSSNLLSGTISPEIGTLSRLLSLNLSHNTFSSSIPDQLGQLSSLIHLDIGFNLLSGSVPHNLSAFRNLHQMILGNNLLSGKLSDNLLHPLTQLQVLVLSHNDFQGDFPNFLWFLPSLQLLDVAVNSFTGTLPNETLLFNGGKSVANLSNNFLYGNLTNVLCKFGSVDISSNYFEGSLVNTGVRNISLVKNCLRNSNNQRSLQECVPFYAGKNLVFDNFGEPSSAFPPSTSSSVLNHNNRGIVVLTSAFAGVGFAIILCIVLFLCKHKCCGANQRAVSVGPVPAGEAPHPSYEIPLALLKLGHPFTYKQILQATDDFSSLKQIKHGHSGKYFRGVLEDGTPVVVKKADWSSTAGKELYVSELNLFSKLSHPRFVPLLGQCLENETDKFLVYKHLPKGDLASSLFNKTHTDDGFKSLDWITRLKIAVRAAEGLCYLHHECDPALVHRDIQASSILLDDNFEVRLGSLSKVCAQEGEDHLTRITALPRTPVQDSSGMPKATCAYDVYCFGKVLMELVTGKLGISSSPETTMKGWLNTLLPCISTDEKELVRSIIDPSLIVGEDFLEEVWSMAIVARSCLNPDPLGRPRMLDILKALENPLSVAREYSSRNSIVSLRTPSSRRSWSVASLFESWWKIQLDVEKDTRTSN